MKKFSLFMAAVLASAALVAIPSNAAVNGDGVLKYTPVIDGKIDAAYMQSANVTHDFPAERDGSNYWGSGKFEFTVNGEKQIVETGDGIYIEPDAEHGCVCLEAGILIDCFSPMRADFLKR